MEINNSNNYANISFSSRIQNTQTIQRVIKKIDKELESPHNISLRTKKIILALEKNLNDNSDDTLNFVEGKKNDFNFIKLFKNNKFSASITAKSDTIQMFCQILPCFNTTKPTGFMVDIEKNLIKNNFLDKKKSIIEDYLNKLCKFQSDYKIDNTKEIQSLTNDFVILKKQQDELIAKIKIMEREDKLNFSQKFKLIKEEILKSENA